MYAVLNPDGSFHELRDGEIQPTTNTANRQKRYAVPVTDTRPVLTQGQRWVNERRVVTADRVTLEATGVEAIPPPAKSDVQVLIAALVRKGTLKKADIDAER